MRETYNVGDSVRYVGSTLVKKHGDTMKKDKIGEVIAPVAGENGDAFVVSFGGDNSYIVHVDSLARHTFKEKDDTTVIERISRKWDSTE